MAAAADDPTLAATDLAELLVERGMPFREAHAVVGGLVRESIASGRALADLVRADERLGADGAAILEPGAAVRRGDRRRRRSRRGGEAAGTLPAPNRHRFGPPRLALLAASGPPNSGRPLQVWSELLDLAPDSCRT